MGVYRGRAGEESLDIRPEPHAKARDLVRGLDSLVDGEQALEAIVAYGPGAIGALREFLLQGRPRGIYQPRLWAVEALARLGAREAVMEYLRSPQDTTDAVVRFGETTVQNAAALALANWQDEETFGLLVGLARFGRLPGAVEVLAQFRRVEAIPEFVRLLSDDFCRSAAETGLRNLGRQATAALVKAATTPKPSQEAETGSSLSCRRAALHLLIEIGVEPQWWKELRELTRETNPELALAACRLCLEAGRPEEKLAAVRRVIELFPEGDWLMQAEIREALVRHYDVARPLVEAAIAGAGKCPGSGVLRMLLSVRKLAGKKTA